MAERQGIEPYGETPWRKSLTGGSDDHTGLFVAGAHTVGPRRRHRSRLSRRRRARRLRAGRRRRRRAPARSQHLHRLLLESCARSCASTNLCRASALSSSSARASGASAATCRSSRRRCAACAASPPASTATATAAVRPGRRSSSARSGHCSRPPTASTPSTRPQLNRRIFTVAQRLADDVVSLHLQPLVDPAVHVGRKRWLQSAFAVGMVHFLQLPYFIAWSLQSRDRASQERLRRHFLSAYPSDPKIAVFTDTFDEVDGVSVSIRRLAQTAAERGVDLEVITSTSAPTGRRGGGAELPGQRVAPLGAEPRVSPRGALRSSTSSTTSRRTSSRPST